MTDRVDVFFKIPGITGERKESHHCHPMGAVNRTRRKHPKAYDIRTVTYHESYMKRFMPPVPPDFKFVRFKTVMKKNMFGQLKNAKAEVMDYDD